MRIKEKIQLFFTGNHRSVTVKKNVIASFVLKGISILISFLLVPLTIGYVSSELYGVWLTLSSILTWFSFFDLGFSQGLKNKLTEAIVQNDWKKGKSLVSTTYFIMIVIFVPVCILSEILVPLINWPSLLNVDPKYNSEIIKVMYVIVGFACLQLILNVLTAVVAAYQKVALSISFNVIANLLSLLIIFILTKTCPPSLFSLSITMSLMPVAVLAVASVLLYQDKFKEVAPNVKSINTIYVKDIFGLGYKIFIINVQAIVLYQTTNVLISNLSSPEQVTTYNIAYKLFSCMLMVFNIVSAPLWPAYTDAYARGDYEWVKLTYKKVLKILLLCIGGCLLLALFSDPIYYIWVGDKVSVPLMMTLLVALYVSLACCVNCNAIMLMGIGKIQLDSLISIIGMVIHIPFSLYLSKYFGAYGVLLSLIFIDFAYSMVLFIQSYKILNKTDSGIWAK